MSKKDKEKDREGSIINLKNINKAYNDKLSDIMSKVHASLRLKTKPHTWTKG